MKCFVASAFGHNDVDTIYDHAILPVLRELRIHPARVDRVEHNEDIDNRIFSLIDECQLCIADLTYARPSVYYEAGYAFGRGKPVIYICRSDHFRVREDDIYGNLRVHFDLQMKNIIHWSQPNVAFRKRLRSRLRYVTRPLLREIQIEATRREHERDFASLSQNEKLLALSKKAVNLLRVRGYAKGRPKEHLSVSRNPFYAAAEKTVEGVHRQIHLLVMSVISTKKLRNLDLLLYPTRLEAKATCRIQSVCVIIALRAVRDATLDDLLPSWTPVGCREFVRDSVLRVHDEIPHSMRITIFDNVSSVEDFTTSFRGLIERLEG